MALAGIFSALRITGEKLVDQQFLFLGAGEAAVGIADLISSAMEKNGLPATDARKRCWLFDSQGLVVSSREKLAHHKLAYAHDHAPIDDFVAAIKALKPTAIIGVAATGGTFTPAVCSRKWRS